LRKKRDSLSEPAKRAEHTKGKLIGKREFSLKKTKAAGAIKAGGDL